MGQTSRYLPNVTICWPEIQASVVYMPPAELARIVLQDGCSPEKENILYHYYYKLHTHLQIILHFLEKAIDENDALNLNNLKTYFIYMVSAW